MGLLCCVVSFVGGAVNLEAKSPRTIALSFDKSTKINVQEDSYKCFGQIKPVLMHILDLLQVH